MFTSRAEYRILLRQDNADERLTEKGFEIGLAERERVDRLNEKRELVNEIIWFLEKKSISPDEINNFLEEQGTTGISQKLKAVNIAARPQIMTEELLNMIEGGKDLKVFKSDRIAEITGSAEIRIKYEGYIQREKIIAEKIKRLERIKIPEDINYSELFVNFNGGQTETVKNKTRNNWPAGRISGVSPSDVNILLMYLGR
jgi:tRNA uridine 5-carboxymethylaminomethyl modification enzyme